MSKIRKSAKGEYCRLQVAISCAPRESVVFCHLNNLETGRGIGLKAPDIFGIYACSNCHKLLDSSSVNCVDIFRALIQTQNSLLEKRLIKCI